MQKAVSVYEEEHGCEIKHFVENYENFLKWCQGEEEQSDGVMTPICFECGAVITAYMDQRPCCKDGNRFKILSELWQYFAIGG